MSEVVETVLGERCDAVAHEVDDLLLRSGELGWGLVEPRLEPHHEERLLLLVAEDEVD